MKTHPVLQSKLPLVEESIFSKMSFMAEQHGAINLSQGFPDFPVPQELIHLVNQYMRKGHNQYAPMAGVPRLREAISFKIERSYDYKVKDHSEITITSGATEGVFAAIMALVKSGDEVIVFDPAYDAYEPAIRLAGGKAVHLPLDYPGFSINRERLEKAVNAKTSMIIINTPHNPSGSVIQKQDIEALETIVKANKLFILSDEVYEHIVYDGNRHHSILESAILRENGVAVFSFGKTFHATGWKVGYTVAPPYISREIQKVHQFLTFSVNTAVQYALADYLKEADHYDRLSGMYQGKRDLFLDLMKDSQFTPIKSTGTYFQLMSYEKISSKTDVEMAEWLLKERGVATIPVSVFYEDKTDHKILRFCFAKHEDTLKQAAARLCKI